MLQRTLFVLMLIVLPYAALAQGDQSHLPPRLISADLPNYPAIAQAAHITGWLKIRVTVNKGRIVTTDVLNTEARDDKSHIFHQSLQFLTTPTLTNLKTWRFDPDANGTFLVSFTYAIAGTETDAPTTPKIEVLPSLDVSVTARPVKPTVNY